jgi:6-phosphogluconolactonase (cycloisomerase 2 family)
MGDSKKELQSTVDGERRSLFWVGAGFASSLLVSSTEIQAEPLNLRSLKMENKSMFAYVGSRTTKERNARGDGITVYRMLPNGLLDLVQIVDGLTNPSYLAMSKDGAHLYTVHGDESEVSSFAVDRSTGKITFLNRQSSQGKNPVHLAIDPTGKFIVVANHIGSSLAVLPIADDGALLPLTQLVGLSGPIGPHRIEQKQAKPHFDPFDPSGRFVVVPDKGLDRIFSFQFLDGKLIEAKVPYVVTREGAGPRNLVFHPTAPLAFVVNELDSTIVSYHFNKNNGSLKPAYIQSTLPPTYTGNSRASGIAIDKKGQFVYASNRGDNSIAVFKIDSQTGSLQFIEAISTLGATPRFFTLTDDEKTLYVLNEDSDTIVALSRNVQTGRLTPIGITAKTGSPVCMVFSV